MGSTLAERSVLSRKAIWIASCIIFIAWSLPVLRAEDLPNKPATEWTEDEALRVLNDSPWAHTVTPTTQAAACDYEHPAFPGLVPEDRAVLADTAYPAGSVSEVVKPDTAEYLVRWVSAKPVQAAIQRLAALNPGWFWKVKQLATEGADGPTDVQNAYYNLRDMITIAVILKRPGLDGSSFLDYAFSDHGREFPSPGWRLWPCAGLKTSSGQVHAYVAPNGLTPNPTR